MSLLFDVGTRPERDGHDISVCAAIDPTPTNTVGPKKNEADIKAPSQKKIVFYGSK